MNPADKYRIINPIGKGSNRKFSTTYSAENKENGQKYILKSLRKTEKNQLEQNRLIQEAKFTFSFPGLPQVADFYETDSELILVSQFKQGKTLSECFKGRSKKDKKSLILTILRELEPILREIHSKQIVHLDLKPSNILFDETTKTVSLIDFGMAYTLGVEERRSTLFPLGYAAPELLLNEFECIDYRTDYFSLGITLWQLLEGKLPLLHPNPSITTNLQISHPLPELSAFSHETSAILRNLSVKPSFKLPPNQLNSEIRKEELIKARNLRFNDLNECIERIELEFNKKPWYRLGF